MLLVLVLVDVLVEVVVEVEVDVPVKLVLVEVELVVDVDVLVLVELDVLVVVKITSTRRLAVKSDPAIVEPTWSMFNRRMSSWAIPAIAKVPLSPHLSPSAIDGRAP